jgi:hypothetical protein
MANNFDSVAFMDTLVESGFQEKQAKALASAMFLLIDSQLVTKDYLDRRLNELRAEFCLGIARLKTELVQLMITILVLQTGAVAVLFKFMH